jgi:hypothetical protein
MGKVRGIKTSNRSNRKIKILKVGQSLVVIERKGKREEESFERERGN